MKRQWVILIVIIIILILVVIFGIFFLNQNKKPEYSDTNISKISNSITSSSKICESISLNDEKDKCYYNYSIIEKNISLCDKIVIKDGKYACYIEIAKIEENFSICNLIPANNDYAYECTQTVSRWGRLSVCENLSSQDDKDACIYQVAYNRKDETVCGLIINLINKKNSCYRLIAWWKKDKSICENIIKYGGKSKQKLIEDCKSHITY